MALQHVKATLSVFMISTTLFAQSIQTTTLNNDWSFQSAVELSPRVDDLGHDIKSGWYPTQLPNTVLNALFENKVIEDWNLRSSGLPNILCAS